MNKEKSHRSIIAFPILAITCGLFLQYNVRAAGTVSTCDDPNLRAAVAGGGLVNFTCNGTIVLTNEIVIANDTTIDATGQSNTISGGNLVRLFKVNPGVRLDLRFLTLANGSVIGFPTNAGAGGAILNQGGTIVLNDCRLLNNSAIGGPSTNQPPIFQQSIGGDGLGGAIWNSNGTVLATNTVFGINRAIGGQAYLFSGGDRCGGSYGGALYQSDGETVLVKCRFQTNSASSPPLVFVVFTSGGGTTNAGGAICQSNGILTLVECEFTANLAAGGPAYRYGIPGSARGGAVFSGATLAVSNCSFAQNVADGGVFGSPGPTAEGGALWIAGPAAMIYDSTFKSNSTRGGQGYSGGLAPSPGGVGRGGAICNLTTLLVLVNSTLCLNEAKGADGTVFQFPPGSPPGTAGFGGALFNTGTVLATNVSASENRAIGGAAAFSGIVGGGAVGGGFCNVGGVICLSYSTLAGNEAIGGSGTPPGLAAGGGLHNTNGTVALSGTIMANSPSGGNAFGTITDNGYNLSSDATCAFAAAGSLNNTDPVLSPLADFGGPTLTMALLAGSPAINGGNPGSFPPADQRGRARPFGPAPDIGAFESSAPYSIQGTITGPATQNPMIVIAGSTNAPLINGSYAIHGEPAGTFPVLPYNSNYFFLPSITATTVGPDKVGVNFKSYKWNTLTLEDSTNSVLHLIFPVADGPIPTPSTFRVLASTNLWQWSILSTNSLMTTPVIGKYSELFIPIGTEPAQFFRAVVP